MRILLLIAIAVAAFAAAACGDDDDDPPEISYETFAPGTVAWVSGFEDGWVKYPRREIFDQPICNEDRVLGNIPHGDEVLVFRKKMGCHFVSYEVEFLEGEQAGAVGWIREQWLVFDDPPPEGPLEPPAPSPSPED